MQHLCCYKILTSPYVLLVIRAAVAFTSGAVFALSSKTGRVLRLLSYVGPSLPESIPGELLLSGKPGLEI